jgi:uncharacterized membrane protein YraQ (UPF0718 family)
MTQKNEQKKAKKGMAGFIFLGVVFVLYITLFILNPENVIGSLRVSGHILANVIPVLIIVILFMGILNYFFKPKTVVRYLGKESGFKGWLIAILAGILSHGPIYIWYPLLKDLQQKGMRKGLIAVFLYNRAIKIFLLPLLIYYFGVEYGIVLLMALIIASVVEGKMIEVLE